MTKHEYFMTFNAFFISIRNYDDIIIKISNNYEQRSPSHRIKGKDIGPIYPELKAL